MLRLQTSSDVHIISFLWLYQGPTTLLYGAGRDMSEPKKTWLKNKSPKQGFTTEILTASLAEGAWLIRCSAWQVTCKACRGWSWGRCKEWNFRMLKEGLALQSHRIIILKEWNSNGNLDFENIIKLFLPWWLIFSKKPLSLMFGEIRRAFRNCGWWIFFELCGSDASKTLERELLIRQNDCDKITHTSVKQLSPKGWIIVRS